MKTIFRFSLALVFALSIAIVTARAEEKNGLSVAVSRTTIDKSDTRGTGGSYDRINRTQGLKAVIRNMTFKEMPEGELTWSIAVKKYYSTTVELYTGTEKLKALKPAETTDMVIGNAEITGYKDISSAEKDKLEWQVVIKQDGKEIIKTQSTSAFDNLAKHAVKASPTAAKKNN